MVVHRIELGPWERSHIGPLTTSLTAKPWLQSFTDIIRDNSALLFVAGLLTFLLPNLPQAGAKTWVSAPRPREPWRPSRITWNCRTSRAAWRAYGGVPGRVRRLAPWGALAGAIAGFFSGIIAVEVGEHISEELQEAAAEAAAAEAEARYAAAQTTTTAILIAVIGLLERIANRDA